jgi:hypothetical protein
MDYCSIAWLTIKPHERVLELRGMALMSKYTLFGESAPYLFRHVRYRRGVCCNVRARMTRVCTKQPGKSRLLSKLRSQLNHFISLLRILVWFVSMPVSGWYRFVMSRWGYSTGRCFEPGPHHLETLTFLDQKLQRR